MSHCIRKKLDTAFDGYKTDTAWDLIQVRTDTAKPKENMNKKERDQIYELKYRKARIDKHDTPVNKFLDKAIEEKKSVTRAIHELLDRETLSQAQLRRNEQDKMEEALKLCSVIFKNILSIYRAQQLELWLITFKRVFMILDKAAAEGAQASKEDDKEYLQRAVEAIKEMERDNTEKHLQNAIPINRLNNAYKK